MGLPVDPMPGDANNRPGAIEEKFREVVVLIPPGWTSIDPPIHARNCDTCKRYDTMIRGSHTEPHGLFAEWDEHYARAGHAYVRLEPVNV